MKPAYPGPWFVLGYQSVLNPIGKKSSMNITIRFEDRDGVHHDMEAIYVGSHLVVPPNEGATGPSRKMLDFCVQSTGHKVSFEAGMVEVLVVVPIE